MAKLVVLTEGMAGRTLELTAEKTTIGRVEDNTFQIPEPSISSHHCEVLLQGSEVKVRDLNSTNGTFINDQPITEAVLLPGQILRLGKVEIRMETAAGGAASAPTPAAPAKKPIDRTVVMSGGVSLNELEQGPRQGGFDAASKAFSKKDDRTSKFFIVGVVIVVAVILAVLAYVYLGIGKTS
jgi:pSer/pThr/pTyr-binding forkhead associated (FHA) protein